MDGRVLHTIDVGSTLHSVVETPEKYNSMVDDGFGSMYSLLATFVPTTLITVPTRQ